MRHQTIDIWSADAVLAQRVKLRPLLKAHIFILRTVYDHVQKVVGSHKSITQNVNLKMRLLGVLVTNPEHDLGL